MKKLIIFVLILVGILTALPLLLAADSGSGSGTVGVQDNDYGTLGLLGVNMDQLQNGTSITSAGWANGNINSNNSCYSEGRSVPYRLFITGGTAGSSHFITLECDWTKSYTHGIDYFTDYDFSEADAIFSSGGSCGSIATVPPSDCQSISGSFPFPDPTDSSNYSSAIPTDFFPEYFDLDGPRYLSFYNAVVDSVSKYYFGGTATDRIFGIKVYFSIINTGSVGFYFGAHMAQSTPMTWGSGNGSSSVSGAAIHVRAINLDNGGTGSGDFSIQINSICQPPDPAISCGVDSVCTDSVYTCSATAGAPSYTWTLTGGTILSGQGTNSITYQVTDPYPGNVMISLDVCDGSDGCPGYYCCADDMVSIMIGACCDPPAATCPGDTTIFACDLSQICLPGFDCNGTATAIGGTLNGNQVCFTPVEGPNSITLICTNECFQSDTCSTTVTVVLNNDPICSIPADTAIFQCSPTQVNLPVTASDIDGNLAGCSIISGPGTLAGGFWQYTPAGDETAEVVIRCSDDCGAYCEDAFQVIFDINDAPICNLQPDQNIAICYDSTLSLPISATDINGNLLGCTKISGVGSFDGSTWTFTTSGTGIYSATFECEDSCGATCTGTVNITITQNSPPTCNLPSDQSFFICADTTFTFPVSATDADDNLAGCTMISGPGSFDGNNWTFTTSGPGVYAATFECEDGCGETCGGTVNITVVKNSVPVCNLPSNHSFFICADTTFTFPVSATDADDNLIGCTMTSGPGSFDGSNWTFTTGGSGVYTAVFECEDECGQTCGGTVSITVSKNSVPICNLPSDQSFFICDDTTFTFPVSATDPDDNLTGCTMTSGPGSFDGSNWTFTTTGSGVYTAVFECEDECGEICGGTVNITVTKNSIPVCNLPSDQSFFICDDTTFTIPVSASDADNNLTGCTMTSGPGSFDGSNWTFTTSGAGIYSASFECEDACGETCGGTVNITVTQNSTPVCNIPSNQSFFICADTTFTFPVSASDADDNMAGCTMTSGPGSFDGSNWTFTTSGSGVYTAVFECEDECGETCGGTVSITVSKNSIPICNLPSDQSFFVCDDTTFTFPVSASDADDNLTGCTMTSGPGSFDGSDWTFTTSGSGVYTAIFECEDECGETCGRTVNITVTKNSVPVCNIPSDQSFFICNDSTFIFPISATDADNNLTGCTMTSGVGSFDGSDWTFTTNGTGVYAATFECADECGETCGGTVNIMVTLNAVPVCNLPPDQSFFINSDSTFNFTISATDADDNLVGCTMTTGPGSFNGSTWTFTATGSGIYSAVFECEDECGQTCGGTVNITITKNSAPICNLPPSQSFFLCQDSTFNFIITASDNDDNLLGCTMLSGPGSFGDSVWTFTTAGSGVYSATFECEDSSGETCGGTVNITVTKNSVPVCNLPSNQSFFICDDTTFTFPVSATDADDNLTGCTMTSGTGSFDGSNWTFTTSGTGVYTAVFECEDECGETCGGTVNITVAKNSVPVCNIPSDQSFFICDDTTFTFPVSATDADDNLVGCTMTSGPGSFDGGNWIFTTSGSGVYTATFECEDECGETCAGTVNITVTRNSIPVCNIPSDQNFFICDDTTFTFPVSAADADGNLTGCTMTSGPGSFDGSNWTFTTSGSGVYTATFECEDECGETCGGTVNITVTRNSVPVCDLPSNQSFFICDDTTFTFPVSATDADDNLAGCTMTSGPGSFDGSNWTFTTTGSGVYTATFQCADVCGETCGGTVNITVTRNSVPVCEIPSDQSFFVCDDTTFTFPVSATDADNNLIGCTMTSGPGSFDGNSWTFTTGGSGVYTATFECEDECGETCAGTVNITITKNSIPVCNIPSDQSFFVCDDTTFTFPVSATDADDNLTGCTMTSGPGSFDGSNWIFTTTGSGIYTATFECEDECGETCGGAVNITVAKNSVPVCNIPSNQSFFICDDTTFTFPVSATDADDNLTGCIMTSGPGSFDGSNWTFTTSGAGIYSASFECEDECGEVCAGSVTITVNMNSAPICDVPDDVSLFICGDTTLDFTITASDADDNLIGCTLLSGPGGFDGNVWSVTISGTGVYTGIFQCEDECGQTCSDTINITVDGNTAPVCDLPDNATYFVCSDTILSFTISADDAEDNLVGCSMTSGPGSFDGSIWTFASTNPGGVYSAVFECVDACGAVCGGTVDITVVYNTAAPVCVVPNDTAIFQCEATEVCLPVTASDDDGNLAGCAIIAGPGSLENGYWCYTPLADDAVEVTIQCTDICGLTCESNFNVAFQVNSPPFVEVPDDTTVLQKCAPSEVCLRLYYEDDENNITTIEIINGPGQIVGNNWCYTPLNADPIEVVDVMIRWTDECGAYTDAGFQVIFEVPTHFAVINLDRSGSMFITDPLGESRLKRAKLIAHEEVDKLLNPVDADFPGMYWISVMAFNASEITFLQDFTSNPALIHAAIDSVGNPKHDTPLAAALCEANCLLPGCEHYIFTYTNGAENVSQNYDLCGGCDSCNQYITSGWNSECDPYNPGGCTQWQMCLYDTYVSNAHHCIHYFDLPDNPFEKAEEPFEDLLYLKALGEESNGCFYYHSDTYAEDLLCGDANNDWTVNVSDAVYIINYVFAGGPAPDPLLAGDANCDGTVNVSDAVWIINYVFTGGFAPCDTDGDGEPDC